MEKKVESYLDKRNDLTEDQLNRSLANMYSQMMKQNNNERKNDEMKDPLDITHIKEPNYPNGSINEPLKKSYNITLPSPFRSKLTEPNQKDPIITRNCEDENNKKTSDNTVTSNQKNNCLSDNSDILEEKKYEDKTTIQRNKKKENISFANETCRKMLKTTLPSVTLPQKTQMPCKNENACQTTVNVDAKSSFSTQYPAPSDKDAVCSSKVNDSITEIYKKPDLNKKECPSQSGSIEVVQVSATDVTCKGTEPNSVCDVLPKECAQPCEPPPKPMGPAQITCVENAPVPVCPSEKEELCQKNVINILEPKCEIDQRPHPAATTNEKKKCDQVPMSENCRFKYEEVTPKGTYIFFSLVFLRYFLILLTVR